MVAFIEATRPMAHHLVAPEAEAYAGAEPGFPQGADVDTWGPGSASHARPRFSILVKYRRSSVT